MIPAARLGDMHQCPRSGHSPSPIISASTDTLINGMGAARVGDTCGCGAVITQGFPSILINGRPLAYMGGTTSHGGRIVGGSSDTFGGFAMGGSGLVMDFARLGVIDDAGEVDDQRLASVLADPGLAKRAIAVDALVEPEQSPVEDPAAQAQTTERVASDIEPGFYIVPESMTRATLEKILFPQADPRVLSHFRSLNPHLQQGARPGQMAIISDPSNLQCTQAEATLMEAAATVDVALASLSDDEARFMVEHHGAIQSFLTASGTAVSTGALMLGKHLDNVSMTLSQLERLHQDSFEQYGHLRHESFFRRRKELMTRLDNSLRPLVRKGAGIPEHPALKHALGVSTRSLTHHWKTAVTPSGIPGYTSHIQGVAQASKYIRRGGWIGVGLSGTASVLKVQEACKVGREDECKYVALTESGKFAGGFAGGVAGGVLGGGAVSGVLCTAIGLGTAGVGGIACALVVVGASSVAGGIAGETGGEKAAQKLYEFTK